MFWPVIPPNKSRRMPFTCCYPFYDIISLKDKPNNPLMPPTDYKLPNKLPKLSPPNKPIGLNYWPFCGWPWGRDCCDWLLCACWDCDCGCGWAIVMPIFIMLGKLNPPKNGKPCNIFWVGCVDCVDCVGCVDCSGWVGCMGCVCDCVLWVCN